MSHRLPDFIDPLQLADKGRTLRGEIPLSAMGRLRDLMADDGGDARFELSFGKEGKLATIKGFVEATLRLVCQNCLGIVSIAVKSDVNLGIIVSLDEVELLPEPYEPLVFGSSKTSLKELVEDELLLGIPAVPKHAEDCLENAGRARRQPLESGEPSAENPFAILARLKHIGEK